MSEHPTGFLHSAKAWRGAGLVQRTLASTAAITLAVGVAAASFLIAAASPALAHEEEKGIPAITDVQEAIAIIASQPELMDSVVDKVGDALESDDTRGVDLDLVRQAQDALKAGDMERAEVLLERSIGACPGAPVIDPHTAPRTPPPLPSPCPTSVPHLQALARTPVGGTQKPVFLAIAGVLILAGLALVRRIR